MNIPIVDSICALWCEKSAVWTIRCCARHSFDMVSIAILWDGTKEIQTSVWLLLAKQTLRYYDFCAIFWFHFTLSFFLNIHNSIESVQIRSVCYQRVALNIKALDIIVSGGRSAVVWVGLFTCWDLLFSISLWKFNIYVKASAGLVLGDIRVIVHHQ